jgi:hypothetical protein
MMSIVLDDSLENGPVVACAVRCSAHLEKGYGRSEWSARCDAVNDLDGKRVQTAAYWSVQYFRHDEDG